MPRSRPIASEGLPTKWRDNSRKRRWNNCALSILTCSPTKTSRQQRGYALERILAELSRLSRLETTEAFRVNGEQVDGAVKFEGEHYLIEAKWQERAASNEPVYQFAGKVAGKLYGRGLFISVNGFSPEVVRSLVLGKEIQTLFIDGEDLILVLEGHLTLRDMIDRKVKAAQTKGLIYVHPISGAEKKS